MSDLDTAFDGPVFGYFCAVRLTLPDASVVRLLDGSATMLIDGETYTGRDPVYGVLSSIESFGEGIDKEAPTLRVGLKPATLDAVAVLMDPEIQRAPIELRIGAFVKATGQVVSAPKIVFAGEVDVPTHRLSRNDREVELDSVTVLENLFDTDTGALLNHAFQTSIFPGDMGLQFQVRVLNHAPAGAVYGGSAGGWSGGYTGGVTGGAP
jgi:hypothetical protein